MKKVTYAGQSFVTTDEVASTLFKYVGAMDRWGHGEAIDLPILTDDDNESSAMLLVWAGSEMVSVPHPSAGPDPVFNVMRLQETADKRGSFRRAESPAEAEYDLQIDIESI